MFVVCLLVLLCQSIEELVDKKSTTKKLKRSIINHNYSVNLEYKQKMNINHLKKENMFTDINDNKSPQVAMLEAMILSSIERKILKTTAVRI